MADLSSTAALYSARPRVHLNGRNEPSLAEGVLTLLVAETTAGLCRCEVTLGNWGTTNSEVGFLYFDRRVLDFGNTLAIAVGAGDTSAQIFDGRVMGLEGHFPQTRPPEIVVLAEDRLQDLRMTRRTRTFDNFSDQEIMQHIASEHGLRTDLDMDGPTYEVLAQVNQSDLAFLRERARAVDAEVWVEGNILHAQTRRRRHTGDVTLTYGQGLREFSVLADLATQRTSLTVSGWDVSSKEGVAYEAAEAAIQGELNGYQSGSTMLQSALGQRAERLVHMVPFTLQEAQALAEAHYRLMARRFVTGRGIAEGDGRLRVGTHVILRGLGALFDGQYYICEVQHTFDGQHGYRTHFAVERAGLGTP